MENVDYDFSGYVTKNDTQCTDGRIIRHGAFTKNDGRIVPMVYQHLHDDPSMIIGKVRLENRREGVYGYCYLNDGRAADDVRIAVKHGDINSMSIYANGLIQRQNNVIHGEIKEVSIVLAGANPGAKIDNICLAHTDGSETFLEEEAIIYSGQPIDLPGMTHSETDIAHTEEPAPTKIVTASKTEESPKKEDDKDETVGDVLDTLSTKQKKAVTIALGAVIDEYENKGGNDTMSHNIFENDKQTGNYLSHEDQRAIFADIKRYGSLRESFIAHGIENLELLFPEAKTLTNTPEFIKRSTEWVDKVMKGVHHTPFSRIKSVFADITEDDARAKGYIKGKKKKEEVFSLLKRTTTPTTVYKKQKFDRDDLVDIVDINVVSWIRSEMRMMLEEELARAIVVGDGRLASSDDKINEQHIRPIWKDDDLFTIRASINVSATDTGDTKAKAFIRTAIKERKHYRGSGNPILLTTEDMLTDCLLMEDTTGRSIYDSIDKLKNKMRVVDIITCPALEKATRTATEAEGGGTRTLAGIIVNLSDYNVGADKGGEVTMMDDFDIDYNAQKYLIETRISGALTKPYSAIAIEFASTASTQPEENESEEQS